MQHASSRSPAGTPIVDGLLGREGSMCRYHLSAGGKPARDVTVARGGKRFNRALARGRASIQKFETEEVTRDTVLRQPDPVNNASTEHHGLLAVNRESK